MKVLIAGAGKKAREILERLGESWEVTLVDLYEERMDHLRKTFHQVVRTSKGDASSAVTLKGAGIGENDFVVAVTNRDEINLEVCKLAKEWGIKNVISLANDSRSLKKFEKGSIRATCSSLLVAREVQMYLEHPHLSVTTIADGRGEIMEIEVTRNSPVVGKKVGEIGTKNWMVAALYREGEELIIHHDHGTPIREGDRVTVVGREDLYHAIYHLFKLDLPSFPMRYGQNVISYVDDKKTMDVILPEARYLVKNTMAQKICILASKEMKEKAFEIIEESEENIEVEIRTLEKNGEDAVISASTEESVGCVLIPPVTTGFIGKIFGQERIIPMAARLGAPLLIAKGSAPYSRILVPYDGSKMSSLALEVANDISRQVKGTISVVVVAEPAFISGKESTGWLEETMNHAREIAQIYRIPINLVGLEGNVVKEMERLGGEHDLMVLGVSGEAVPLLKPKVNELIAARCPCSVLAVAL